VRRPFAFAAENEMNKRRRFKAKRRRVFERRFRRATFPFWRSRKPSPFDNLRSNMRALFDRCVIPGVYDESPVEEF
jgi:hypothetical protein